MIRDLYSSLISGLQSLPTLKNEVEEVKKDIPPFGEWLAEVSPTFTWHWKHLQHIRSFVDRVIAGEVKKLMLFVPPRHGKSEQVTVRLPAWYLERWPDRRVIVGAYNQTLANKFSRKTRKIANGRVDISSERTAVEDWETNAGGGLRAVGVGGGITGQGGNLIIIDDPVKNREEANSSTYREKVWDWYTDDLYTRLEPGGAIILIMTRWHDDDLAGRILKSEDGPNWTVINLPALAEENDALGRSPGEALCPERYNEDDLAKIKVVMGSGFQALYQQRPSAEEGDIFKREWWRYYREAPDFRQIVQSWDTGFKKETANDFSVCTTWGVGEKGFYLLDRWKEKVEYPQLKRAAASQDAKWRPRVVLIEDKASGQSLIQELTQDTTIPVRKVPVGKYDDKISRAHAVTPTIEAGRVFLPEDAPWLSDYLDEMALFPNGEHDDDVDSTTQALNYFRKHVLGSRAFEDYADAVKEIENRDGNHHWQPTSNPSHYQCERCKIAVAIRHGETAQEASERVGQKECKP